MRLRLPGNDRDTILQYRLGPDLADIALRLEEVVQDDPHHAAYQIVGMADLIESQAARIAELEESLDAMARGEAWFIDLHAYKNVMTGEYASAVKRATPNFPFDGGARFLDRDGYKEHCWLSECYPTHEAAEAARKVTNDE